MENFTLEELVVHYYGEMSAERSRKLIIALSHNWALKEKLQVITEAAERLDNSLQPPRKEALNAILKYAASRSSATI